ncbi:transcriptional regulator [Polaribacter sp. SA4-10]|uniref:ArsR/SmtB family transcription factor n=1 Tax=Polaribacter sp. SA4-10 TaxID=754397 RepID=UPI000B3D00FD|nr:metalloregulator ArsR/SmtB family transcription factor [Polaribacter sp. SA4-10]ARV05662.1 transcriptional regulator [Polaribacter sp. SA4-10]
MEKAICIRLKAYAKQIINCREVVQELETSFEDLSNILSLTGNPVRLKILYLLNQEGRLCVCDLSDILEMNVSAISQHLRKLKDRKLIYSQKEAQTIFYSIKKDKISLLTPFFKIVADSNLLEVKL